MRILIVDDDDVLRRSVGITFERAGHVVMFARDGEEGIRLALKHAFDVVLSDIDMPVCNGLELLAAIKKTSQCAATIVVLMSTMVNIYGDVSLQLGAGAFFAKPIPASQLVVEVEMLLAAR